MDNTDTSMPSWLDASTTATSPTPSSSLKPTAAQYDHAMAVHQLDLAQREILFENVIAGLENGSYIENVIETHPYKMNTGNFLAWVVKDPTRKKRYDEALEIWGEAMMHRQAKIASGEDSLQDVQRSALMVSTNFKLMEIVNRKRFGKDAAPPSPFGQGGITVNINAVQSPYDKSQAVDVTPKSTQLLNSNE